jgi:DNA primase catalytic core
MRPRLINLEATTNALRPYLEQYLQEHGIDTSKHFKCIHPKHDENAASMTCKQVPERAFCFGCGYTADIFAAAHCIEGKPMRGVEYINDNVLYLAKKYNVNVKLEDLTPEEIYEYRTYQAYKLAANMVKDPDFGDYSIVDKEIARRGWDKNKIAEWGIGTVDFSEFRDRLKAAGYEPRFLGGVDLDRSNLFNNNNLLFTVYDDRGRPVGFSAKNLKYNGDGASGPKYINTRGTGLECAIFRKGERLYGYDIAKEAPDPLYIFEGQADVITARHHGLMNCCCTMGTALTDHHITLLKKHGSFNVVLVFDSDQAGELAVQKALDEKFAKEKDFRVKLCQLPKGLDPDDLLRTSGFDEFVRLKRWTAFEWRMMKFVDEFGGDLNEDQRREVAEKMIPIIVAETSHIRQEDMAKQVARMTGYDLATIIAEIKRQKNEKDAKIQTRKTNLIETLVSEVRRNPNDAELALAQCQNAIDDINKSLQVESEESSGISTVSALKEADENKSGEFAGFFMKPEGLGGIAARLDDDWRRNNLVFVGGSEQAGKTTFSAQMAFEIADDPRNNAICIYHSIDDAKKYIIYKLICNAAIDKRLTLNMISNPNYWSKQESYDFLHIARETAYRKTLKMVKENKIIIKDASDGASVAYASNVTRYYRELYPEKNIVLFIDNFHKLPDYGEITGHERVKRLSNHLKNMAVLHGITIISTVEYRKLQPGEKPTNMAIAESRSLAYDSSVIIHLYNDLHHRGEKEAVLVHKDNEGNILPRVWCKFGKNKVSGYEGREFLDLHPANARMAAVQLEIAEQDQKERLAYLKDNDSREQF